MSIHTVPSLDSPVEKRGEGEKERDVVTRVLSRFRPKEVKRREQHHSRRRAIRQETTTTREFLSEKLRLINPYTNVPSSSSLKHHQTLPSRLNLQQQQSKVKSLLEKSQGHAGIISSSSMERTNCYSKLLPFPEMFAGGRGFQKLAPAVHIRSVIPVCSAPPPKLSPSSAPSSLGSGDQEKKPLRLESNPCIKIVSLDQPML